jgi:hypothetical protein
MLASGADGKYFIVFYLQNTYIIPFEFNPAKFY